MPFCNNLAVDVFAIHENHADSPAVLVYGLWFNSDPSLQRL